MKNTVKEVDFSQNRLDAEVCAQLLGALEGGSVEKIILSRCCLLDYRDAEATKIAQSLRGVKHTLKEVDFSLNRDVPAEDWELMLGALAGGVVEKISFKSCSLDGAKAAKIAQSLRGVKHTVKEV